MNVYFRASLVGETIAFNDCHRRQAFPKAVVISWHVIRHYRCPLTLYHFLRDLLQTNYSR